MLWVNTRGFGSWDAPDKTGAGRQDALAVAGCARPRGSRQSRTLVHPMFAELRVLSRAATDVASGRTYCFSIKLACANQRFLSSNTLLTT